MGDNFLAACGVAPDGSVIVDDPHALEETANGFERAQAFPPRGARQALQCRIRRRIAIRAPNRHHPMAGRAKRGARAFDRQR